MSASTSYLNYSNSATGTPVEPSLNTYHHETLERISRIADIEMASPPPEESMIIIDTNIVLHFLHLISTFVDDIAKNKLPIKVIVPKAVINELDAQKSNRSGERVGWFARQASTWILAKMSDSQRIVRGQATNEVFNRDAQRYGERNMDQRIVDCCLFWASQGYPGVCLFSDDTNLNIDCKSEAQSRGFTNLIAVKPKSRHWSSFDFASALFPEVDKLHRYFSPGKEKNYNDESQIVKARHYDDDRMDVDEELTLDIGVVDAMNSLHLQVVQHFTALLLEMVYRHGQDAILERFKRPIKDISIYAPKWERQRKELKDWDIQDLTEYLLGESRIPLKRRNELKNARPSLAAFLSEPYSKGTGAKTGREWSKQDWLTALRTIKELGDAWNDPRLQESLNDLEPVLSRVFMQEMAI